MKYASEMGGRSTSVHEWKPITPERFSRAIHALATECGADQNYDFGNEGMGGFYPQAMKLDRETTATIYYMPKHGKAPDSVSSPVLLTILGPEGKCICFENLKYQVPGI